MALAPKTLIIADNDKFQRQLIDMLLAEDRYKVIEFENGRDLLSYLKRNTPDLALLSTDLSDINGADICSKMKRNTRLKNVPVILISSQLQHETINALARAVHADLVVEKPLGDKNLKKEVRKLLNLNPIKEFSTNSDNLLIIEEDNSPDNDEYFYMNQTLINQTIPIKHTPVPESLKDTLPPIDEPRSVEIDNVFIANSNKEQNELDNFDLDEVGLDGIVDEIDVLDAVELDLLKSSDRLETKDIIDFKDKTNIEQVVAEQETYQRESWRKELDPTQQEVEFPIPEIDTEEFIDKKLHHNNKQKISSNQKQEMAFLKAKLEELIEENEGLKAALRELKNGKSLVTTESYLDNIEELEALRRLTESQQNQIQDLRRENKILRKSMESFLARQKNPLWGNRNSKMN